MNNLGELENNLKVTFKNKKLLTQALTHRSFLNETSLTLGSNERLEFLGDAILSFVISVWLYQQLPDYPEGNLTNLRSNLVRTSSLAKLGRKLKIGDYLLLSKGEKGSGGQKNPSLLANGMEAIIGAIYLDQGLEKVKKFLHFHFSPDLDKLLQLGQFKDYKSILQEKLQAEMKQSPNYKILNQHGPDHSKTFIVGVYNKEKLLAKGVGKSKQKAEQQAAKIAYEKIT